MSKHKLFLKEIAKFTSGLVAADFICGAWLHSVNLPPINFLWTVWSPRAISMWMIFDVVLFLVLINYGWHSEIKNPSIKHKTYFIIVGLITGAVAIIHLARVITGFGADISGWNVPLWFSWVGVLVAGFVSYASFRFASKSRE